MAKLGANLSRLCNAANSRILLTFPRTSLFRPYIPSAGIDMNVNIMPADGETSTSSSTRKGESKMASGLVECKFPVGSLVPKSETNVLNFLQKYPSYDGRGITIAIFDSGVDPRVAGLQTTIDGSVKVIERYDCSGCGDTDLSKKVTADEKGLLTGLSGRSLKITSFMKSNNKDDTEYRVGMKSLHDLYPSKIREKVASEEKLKIWDPPHKKSIAEASRQLQTFESTISDPQSLTLKEKLTKDDMEGSLEYLNGVEKKYFDSKTPYDCVLFKTDRCWYAVIDISETGDLEKGVLIGEYSKTHEIKNIDNYLSISINVHDDGNLLEIVGMCSSHGTHVASIASGNHLDKKLDGVAPNAKIVSLTIGDGRLGSMETGTALVRAIIKVMELCNSGTKIDVINMSYGEHAGWSNTGRIGSLMNEVVNKYGVVWVASAGNHGPALCTIGTPPDISQPCCIGVGAYVSPQMMEAEYALREKLPGNVYTWTSRDPCIDGGQGVTVCAPGAAITSVPEFTMARAQLMNGTSMAAPHVAGAIALLISGLKQRNIKYSPFSIKRAIWNTATKLDYIDIFAQGNGLLNVEKAFENLIQYASEQENLIRFSVRVGNQNAKGIHLRQGVLKAPIEYSVNIEPIFFNEKEAAPKDKINFNVRLSLMSSVPWVQCGAYLDLCYVTRNIVVRVDPTGLGPGVHKASIKAYDSNSVEKGTLFEIPITVVQPIVIQPEDNKNFSVHNKGDFKPNTINRSFILVPNNATWAVLRMVSESDKDNNSSKFFVHTMQILPHRYCKALETMKILPVNNQNETVHAFKCEQNNILELCVAKYWSNFGDTQIRFRLDFHGITSNGNNVMHSANGIHRIDLTALGNEEICPGAQIKTATIVLKPNEAKITPLTSRDILPEGRQIYQNLLTYNLHLSKSQEIALHAPILSTVLYESEYESQFWMLFDSNKMMMACGDAYSNSQYTKLEKGDYVVKLQVRHEKKDILEKISEATMLVTLKLPSPISLDIYEHYNHAVIGGKKISSFQLNASASKTLYIAPLSNEKITKASLPAQCSWLGGSIAYAKDDVGRKCDNNVFQYVLIEGPPVKKSNGASPKKSNNNNGKSKSEEYQEGLRDYQCTMIPKLEIEAAEEIYKEILVAYPKHFPAHLALIQLLETHENTINFPFSFKKSIVPKNGDGDDKIDNSKLITNLKRIAEIASSVINETDRDALLTYYGMKTDTRSDAAKIKITVDKNKNNLVEAYCKKGIALCKLMFFDNDKSKDGATLTGQLDEIDAIYTEIGKFIDPIDAKVLYFTLWHAYVHNHYGRMTKCLQKLYEEKNNKEILEELASVTLAKNWEHITKHLRRTTVYANPMSYRPF